MIIHSVDCSILSEIIKRKLLWGSHKTSHLFNFCPGVSLSLQLAKGVWLKCQVSLSKNSLCFSRSCGIWGPKNLSPGTSSSTNPCLSGTSSQITFLSFTVFYCYLIPRYSASRFLLNVQLLFRQTIPDLHFFFFFIWVKLEQIFWSICVENEARV